VGSDSSGRLRRCSGGIDTRGARPVGACAGDQGNHKDHEEPTRLSEQESSACQFKLLLGSDKVYAFDGDGFDRSSGRSSQRWFRHHFHGHASDATKTGSAGPSAT